VSPALNALIMRLLAPVPVERFRGRAREAAEALEHAAEGAEGEVLLFGWGHEHSPRVRSPGGVRLAEEQDVAARQHQAQRKVEEGIREAAGREQALPSVWGGEMAVALLGLLLAGLLVAVLHPGQEGAQAALDTAGGRVAVGDSASATSARMLTTLRTDDKKQGVALPLPEKPLPGQSRPPCKRTGEVEIRGGCWHRLADAKPPCKEEGKEDAYVWKGACYGPSYPVGREPTSNPP
jgi:hypothetical protein